MYDFVEIDTRDWVVLWSEESELLIENDRPMVVHIISVGTNGEEAPVRHIRWLDSEGGGHSHAFLCSPTGVVPARPLCGQRIRVDGPNNGKMIRCKKCLASGQVRGMLPIPSGKPSEEGDVT